MATIHDVAKKAGVAPITVSRVINNSGYVSDKVRMKVNEAVQELGYVPNVLARSLKSKRTHTLALVLTDMTNPFFNILARGVEDTASENGFNVIFCNTDESQTEENKYIQLLLQKQVDGILLVPASSGLESIELIRQQNTPLVIVDRRVQCGDVDMVYGDSEGGAYQLTEYLINLGHRHISFLGGPQIVSTSEDRLKGYQRAMEDNKLQDYIDCYYGKYTQQSGIDLTRQLFSRSKKPTALVASNNLIAIGVLSAFREMKIKVPEEVAVVAFDDIPENLNINPFLTVVAQPPHEMGKKATEILLSRIMEKSGSSLECQEIKFPVELIVRTSCGGHLQK